jgi:outer membrane protein assembly factor BamB
VIDADDDPAPDLFPTGGTEAISGRTGEPLWEAPIPKGARLAVGAELNGQAGRDVALSITPPGASTDPTKNLEPLTANTVFAFSGTGALLFQHRAVSTVTGLGAADLDGDGIDEVIAATFNGVVYALGLDGLRWTAATGLGPIDAVTAADIDGDGLEEIFLGTGRGLNTLAGDVFEVMALSPQGAQLWRTVIDEPVSTMRVVELDGDEPPELLVGAGTTTAFGNGGIALALNTDPLAVDRELWHVDAQKEVKSFAVATIAGRRVVVIGSTDSLLRGVEPATGEPAWSYTLGGYARPVTTADLDGDGGTEVIHGDDQGYLVVSDEDGAEAWSARLDVGPDGYVDAVAAADVDQDRRTEIAAAGSRFFQSGPGGTLELYGTEGTPRWKVDLEGAAAAIRTADLDGDGDLEIVIAEGGSPVG